MDISQTPEMKGVYSRVRLNSEISRKDMLLLALMSSENRAAASLAHHYPGGYKAFIKAMNAKAKSLGMNNTRFVEPTGLSVHNVSTARDLTKLLIASKQYPLIGQLSTTGKIWQPSLTRRIRCRSAILIIWCIAITGIFS
ncbi:penicillin-binding protein 7 [Escherichia coli]|nr:penicillin-binding protein 7 [Escherichia coli]